MNAPRIAIVGAGVAGMALAILATKQGHQVSLYERDNTVSSIGAGITLWPNAMFVLQQLGIDKEIERLGGTPRFMRQFDHQGSRKGELDIDELNMLCGLPSVTILRRDLMHILASALEDQGVEMHAGCSLTTQDIDRLKQESDLVVGADGRMNSVVRQTLFTDKVTPRYQGFINIIGISEMDGCVWDNAIHDFRGPGERFGIVPVKAGSCYWAAAWATPIDRERPVSGWYDEMLQRFRNWPALVQDVLHSRDQASLNRIFVHDIDPLPYWHRDNVLIIGDAAHAPLPTSGQGACQALEDAWHLCRLLGAEDSLQNVLNAFYQRRIAKTSAAQNTGRRLARSIFTEHSEPQPSVAGISPEQLSQFWMQGLEIN